MILPNVHVMQLSARGDTVILAETQVPHFRLLLLPCGLIPLTNLTATQRLNGDP
jgi:hypothetical protein